MREIEEERAWRAALDKMDLKKRREVLRAACEKNRENERRKLNLEEETMHKVDKILGMLESLTTTVGTIVVDVDEIKKEQAKMRKDFAKLAKKVDNIEIIVDKLESRMDKLESRMDKLESRMGKLEEDNAGIRSQLWENTEMVKAIYHSIKEAVY